MNKPKRKISAWAAARKKKAAEKKEALKAMPCPSAGKGKRKGKAKDKEQKKQELLNQNLPPRMPVAGNLHTVCIKLAVEKDDFPKLLTVQAEFANACNLCVPLVCEHRCWNGDDLHRYTYFMLGRETPLHSQMRCNVRRRVCTMYKSLNSNGRIDPKKPVPEIDFKRTSVHYDKRTYTLLKNGLLSLYTLEGRVKVRMLPGEFQKKLLATGKPKEAELVFKNGCFYFHLVIESDKIEQCAEKKVMGIDVGENNIAAHSLGRLFGGRKLLHERDKYLAQRRRLQSNGSRSAKQKLRKVSGKETRHVRQVNHEVSKMIVQDAVKAEIGCIGMEDLTHMRERVRLGLRERSHLHSWSWRQLHTYVEYKARAEGIDVVYVNPAYTSQTCSHCGNLGTRKKHRFVCSTCGIQAHSDLNAGRNVARMVLFVPEMANLATAVPYGVVSTPVKVEGG
jgi:IS605 OrfB family transposase